MLMYILLLVLIISSAEGDFDVKLKFCRLKCGCGNTGKSASKQPSGYYWRDFHGIIPPDAVPIGDEHQYPQTYVGFVFDPLNNGTYVTTIVDGLDYVYNVKNGTVFKKTSVIQILCTSEPESLIWKSLTSENASSVSKNLVTAGLHLGTNKYGSQSFRTFFIAKVSKCKIGYASNAATTSEELEYAAMDGTVQKSVDKMFLLYMKSSKESTSSNGEKKKPFISHSYKYSIKGGSIIPNFYKQINVGSCSLTCTNEGMDKKKKKETNQKSSSAMQYYWKSSNLIEKNEGILVGVNTYTNKSEFVGQGYTVLNWYDVGQSHGKDVQISFGKGSVSADLDIGILSSINQDKFEWISTTAEKFATLDRARMVPGGQLDNGTVTFVGRELNPTVTATSVRVLGSVAYSYSVYGAYSKFDVLMIKDDKRE